MPGPPQNQSTGSGDIFQWLEEALLEERRIILLNLEQKHQGILSEVKQKLANTNGKQASEGPSAETNGSTLLDGEADNKEAMGSPPSRQLATQKSSASPSSGRKGRGGPAYAVTPLAEEDHGMIWRIRKYINGPYFEVFFGGVIVVSAIIMGLEMQYRGLQTGYTVDYLYYDAEAVSLWPWAEEFFVWAEWILGILFTAELVLKVFAQGPCKFARDGWNWIDVLIVGSWLVTAVLDLVVQDDIGFNPTLLRLLRLMRLLRLLKLLGMISIFDSLYLMTTAIKGSTSVLLWGVLVLTVVEMLLACLLQSMVEDYLRDPSIKGSEAGFIVYRHFGSFARSMLTMFEMTLGNWMVPCRSLVENVSEWYMLFFLMHKFIIGFSVVSVITGVFIQETFKVATSDDQIMMNNKKRTMREHEAKMKEFFAHADADGSGSLDQEEFVEVMHQEKVRTWLSSMGLDVEDAEMLFQLVNGGDDHVDAHELVIGASKLKGSARSIDLNILMNEFRKTKFLIESVHAKVQCMDPMGNGLSNPYAPADASSWQRNGGNSMRPKESPGGTRLFC